MRVLVSGATGVIGRRVVPLLLSEGHSVTALIRSPEARECLEKAGARCVVADIFGVETLKRPVAGQDAVINLATHMPSSTWKMLFRSEWRLNDRIRTEGVSNLVDAAIDGEVGRLIQESFAPTYPDRGESWIDEETPLAPAAYNRTILDAEKSVARFSSHGRAGVVLRFAAFYGPDAIQVQSYIDGLRKRWALLPGGPDRFISSISHDDAATAVVAALKAPTGPYNVTDDEPVRRKVYFGTLATDLELKQPRFLPMWTTHLFASVGETMARSLRLSNRKLRRATTWAPKFPSVREGWPATLAEMKET